MELNNKFVLSIKEASIFTGISQSTIKRLIVRGEFVEGIKLTSRRVVYKKTDIENWVNKRPKTKSEITFKKKVRCPSNLPELKQAFKLETNKYMKNKRA